MRQECRFHVLQLGGEVVVTVWQMHKNRFASVLQKNSPAELHSSQLNQSQHCACDALEMYLRL